MPLQLRRSHDKISPGTSEFLKSKPKQGRGARRACDIRGPPGGTAAVPEAIIEPATGNPQGGAGSRRVGRETRRSSLPVLLGGGDW